MHFLALSVLQYINKVMSNSPMVLSTSSFSDCRDLHAGRSVPHIELSPKLFQEVYEQQSNKPSNERNQICIIIDSLTE